MGNNGELRRTPEITARFAQIVKEVGTPEPYTLWQAPESDPRFQRAVRENRVLTVVQSPVGTKKDYALVGYHKEKNASYLIFPGSLRKFENKKIIGVKYDLLVEPQPVGPVQKPKPVEQKAEPKKAEEKPFQPVILPRVVAPEPPKKTARPKAPKRFVVTLTVTAELQIQEEVEADNQVHARKLAEKIVREKQSDFSNAPLKIQLRKVRPLK